MVKVLIGIGIIFILIILLKIISKYIFRKRLSKEDEIDFNDLIEEIKRDSKTRPTFLFGNEEKNKEEEDNKYPYPIKKSQAKKIANEDYTLKTDFRRNSNRNEISWIAFRDYTMDIIEKDEKKYWQFQVTKGEISWVEWKRKKAIYCDGDLGDEDFKYLRCLIDVETGDYIYYPQVETFEERIVKYVEPNQKNKTDKFAKFFQDIEDENGQEDNENK